MGPNGTNFIGLKQAALPRALVTPGRICIVFFSCSDLIAHDTVIYRLRDSIERITLSMLRRLSMKNLFLATCGILLLGLTPARAQKNRPIPYPVINDARFEGALERGTSPLQGTHMISIDRDHSVSSSCDNCVQSQLDSGSWASSSSHLGRDYVPNLLFIGSIGRVV